MDNHLRTTRLFELTDACVSFDFTEWTADGHLRHSRFVVLREDKTAQQVVRQTP
jgi:hypothetical protein